MLLLTLRIIINQKLDFELFDESRQRYVYCSYFVLMSDLGIEPWPRV